MVKTGDYNLNKFFYPDSVAIIGASMSNYKVGGILLNKVLKSKIKVFPVNPSYKSIMNVKCYASVLDIEEKIDLAVIAIPAEHVGEVLEECGKKKVSNAIIISAGFSELGNINAEKELLEKAKKYKIRFIGTNCFGICNPEINLDLTFSSSMPHKGDIAFLSQSGALWSYISDLSAEIKAHFGFSKFVSLGNMDDLDFNHFINYLSKDKKTKSIVLYIERLKEGDQFIKLCKNITKKKKIYAIKGGSSTKGQKAEFSHTASLASNYSIYKGAFKQAGVEFCESLVDAFEKASGKKILSFNRKKIKIGKKIFVITNAGGAGVLISDYLSNNGFTIVEQPLDILGTANAEEYSNAMEKVKDKIFDSLIIIITPQMMTDVEEIAKRIVDFKRISGKKVITFFLGGERAKSVNKIINGKEIINFNSLEEGKECLEI